MAFYCTLLDAFRTLPPAGRSETVLRGHTCVAMERLARARHTRAAGLPFARARRAICDVCQAWPKVKQIFPV